MDNLLKELQNIIFEYVDGDVIIDVTNKIFNKITNGNDDLHNEEYGFLCQNKNAIHIIEKINYKTYSVNLCFNENAVHLIEENLHNFEVCEYNHLIHNKNAIHILDKCFKEPPKYPSIINWSMLSESVNVDTIYKKYPKLFKEKLEQKQLNWKFLLINKNAVNFIEDIFKQGETHPYFHRIDFDYLCTNESIFLTKKKYIQKFIEKVIIEGKTNEYFEKLNLKSFCLNKNAIHKDKGNSIISDYLTNIIEEGETHPLFCKISWKNLCYNENIMYIKDKEGKQSLIEKIIYEGETNPYFNKLCWENLCKNKGVINIIKNIINEEKKNLLDKIDWHYLSGNDEAVDIIVENIDKTGVSSIMEYDKNKLSGFFLFLNNNLWDKYSDKCLRKLYLQ